MSDFMYRFFGYWVRREACRLAAQSMPTDWKDANFAVRIWSLTVFFERYLLVGANGTHEDFGPKGAPVLSLIPNDNSSEAAE